MYPFRKVRLTEGRKEPSTPNATEGANVTTSAAATRPISAADAVFDAVPDDDEQQLRRALTDLLVQWPDREATTFVLRLLDESRKASPPPHYQYIRHAYSEYASNIRYSWLQVGDYLRKAMRAIEPEGVLAERD